MKQIKHRRIPKKKKEKNLAKNPEENEGISYGRNFEKESEFRDFLADWLEDREIKRAGYRKESKNTKDINKKETAKVIRTETEPQTESGNGDIAIHHDFLNLSYDHVLASPLIIECKNKDSFRYAAEQAVRYKHNSSEKYQDKDDYQFLNTAIATPKSLSTGEIASRHGSENPFLINFEAKRIYWKLGIGVSQSIKPDQLVISFNEFDKAVIK